MDYSQHKILEFRRKFLVLVGAQINVADPQDDKTIGFIRMKAWKLKEDVRLYTDESQSQEVFRIHARNVIDFGGTYDVFDSNSNQQLFTLRRKGLKSSFVRDHWDILDNSGNAIGDVQETSKGLAFVRRWLEIIPVVGPFIDLALAFAPQTYSITINGKQVAGITHRKNPFIVKMSLDRSMDQGNTDPRISMAATSLLSIIDASK
jgi:hypothetical protein